MSVRLAFRALEKMIKPFLSFQAPNVEDQTQARLRHFKNTEEPLEKNEKAILGKRKFIRDVKKKTFTINKGPKFSLTGKPRLLLDLTSEVLARYF